MSMEYELLVPVRARLPVCSEQDLAAFEASIGFRLPADHRRFLMEWNGVDLEHNLVYPAGESDVDEDAVEPICYFFGVSADPTNLLDIRHASFAYGFDLRVPARFLPITSAWTWNYVCLSLDSPDFGQVYRWSGIPDEDYVPTMDFLYLLAPSFKDFWKLPRPEKEGDFL